MGVSGCGKSTIAGILAGQPDWGPAEGDDLHPAANVAKISAGIHEGRDLLESDPDPRIEIQHRVA